MTPSITPIYGWLCNEGGSPLRPATFEELAEFRREGRVLDDDGEIYIVVDELTGTCAEHIAS